MEDRKEPAVRTAGGRSRGRELLVSLVAAAIALPLVATIRALMPTTEGTVLGLAILAAAWIGRNVAIDHLAAKAATREAPPE